MIALVFSILGILSLIIISYFFNFNIALSVLLFIGGIHHLSIILKDGIKKEDFTKKNIENMKPVGASSLIWLIFDVISIVVILYYIEPMNFIFFN